MHWLYVTMSWHSKSKSKLSIDSLFCPTYNNRIAVLSVSVVQFSFYYFFSYLVLRYVHYEMWFMRSWLSIIIFVDCWLSTDISECIYVGALINVQLSNFCTNTLTLRRDCCIAVQINRKLTFENESLSYRCCFIDLI